MQKFLILLKARKFLVACGDEQENRETMSRDGGHCPATREVSCDNFEQISSLDTDFRSPESLFAA